MANNAEVMGRIVNKFADSRENPKHFPNLKENGRRWCSIAGAGLTIIGLGAVVFNAVVDFFCKPVEAPHKENRDFRDSQGRSRH
jgi:hypothetical protein